MDKEIKSVDALATARTIAMQARLGNLTYEKAKEMAQPWLDIVNTKGKETAKKFGRKWIDITFSKIAR